MSIESGRSIMFKRIMIIAENYKLIDSLLRYTPLLFPDAEFHVVSIVDYSYDIMSATSFIDDSIERSAVRALFHCIDTLKEMGIKARRGFYKGNFEAIVENYVRRKGIDLVATETPMEMDQKRSHVSWHLEKIFRTRIKNVLILDRMPNLRRPKRIFIVVGDSPKSWLAAERGITLCREFGATCGMSYAGRKARTPVYERFSRLAEQNKVDFEIREFEWSMKEEIPTFLEEFDLVVMSRGGYRLRDQLKMMMRALPLSRGEMNILLYAPIPVLLVGGERG
ncbi:MAG: hypothetical protein ACE5QF_00250 [Thermoplasmata archaeon]